jgi:hypothetical protein
MKKHRRLWTKNAETYPRALCSPLLATFAAFTRSSWSWMPVSYMHRFMNSRSNFVTESIVRRVPHSRYYPRLRRIAGNSFLQYACPLPSKRWAATLFIPGRIYQSTPVQDKIKCSALINTGCILLAIGASDQETQGVNQTNSKRIRCRTASERRCHG